MTATTQTGFRVHAWGQAPVWEEFARPAPGPGEVEVAVEACGVGLTVLNCIDGNLADDRATLPVVPGHELVGRVERCGPNVDPALRGRRVAAYFYRFCGVCSQCSAGQQSRCANLDGWIGVHSGGGYAPWSVLPARNAVVLDEGLDPVAATVVADAVATPLHVCGTRAQVRPSDRVVVVGAGGGVGTHMVQVAALFGARVLGLDVGDAKLAAIEQLGAGAVDSASFDTVDAGALWDDGPPTVVIDLVGSDASLAWSSQALGMGGRLVVLTTFAGRTLTVEPRRMVLGELTLLGSRYATVDEVATAAMLVTTGRITPVIGKTVQAAAAPALHDALRSGELVGRGALVW